MKAKLRWNNEPVEVFTSDQRDRSEYIAFIIADGDKAIPYYCNAEDFIIDPVKFEFSLEDKWNTEAKERNAGKNGY